MPREIPRTIYVPKATAAPRLPDAARRPIRVPAIAATRHRVEELLENLDIEQLVNNSADTLAAVNGPGQTLRSEA